MFFWNIFFDIDADSAYLERCILSCLGAMGPKSAGLRDSSRHRDQWYHACIGPGPLEPLFRYDMGDKSLAQPPTTSQNRRFAIIDPQIGLIPSPKWIVWSWNRQNIVETHLPKPNSQAPQVCLISSGVEQYWSPVLGGCWILLLYIRTVFSKVGYGYG